MKLFLPLLCGLLLAGCTPDKKEVTQVIESVSLHELKGDVFGSYYLIKYRGALRPEDLKTELESFFQSFNSEFSTYQKDSVISQLNGMEINKRLKVSPRFIQMLELSKKLYQDTEGAFDPTLSPVIKLWGFGGGKRVGTPSEAEIKEASAKTGLKYLHWNQDEVWKSREVSLDVNGFAPGWAGDLIGELLEKHSVQDYMVDISGEILVKGSRSPQSLWVLGIEKPSSGAGQAVQLAFRLRDAALATSGNYRQFFDDQGKRYSHILDPRTARPVEHNVSSASVIAPTAAEADAWGTALMVLGEEGIPLAEKKGIKSYLIKSVTPEKFEEIYSPSMRQHIQQNPI